MNHEKAQYSKFWKSIKFLRNDAQKKRKESREISKQKPIRTKMEGKGETRKRKQELAVLSAHQVHIANLVMYFGMKPFPLKSLPRKYGQSSWNKTDSKHRRVFTSIQISQGNLNKVLPIASIKQKVIFPMEDIASKPERLYRLKKREIYKVNATAFTYIFTRSRSATACICSAKGNDAHD